MREGDGARADPGGVRAGDRAGRLRVPQQTLTDNAKVFTGRFAHPPAEPATQ